MKILLEDFLLHFIQIYLAKSILLSCWSCSQGALSNSKKKQLHSTNPMFLSQNQQKMIGTPCSCDRCYPVPSSRDRGCDLFPLPPSMRCIFFEPYNIFCIIQFQSNIDIKSLYRGQHDIKFAWRPVSCTKLYRVAFFDFGRCAQITHSNFKNSTIINCHLLPHVQQDKKSNRIIVTN